MVIKQQPAWMKNGIRLARLIYCRLIRILHGKYTISSLGNDWHLDSALCLYWCGGGTGENTSHWLDDFRRFISLLPTGNLPYYALVKTDICHTSRVAKMRNIRSMSFIRFLKVCAQLTKTSLDDRFLRLNPRLIQFARQWVPIHRDVRSQILRLLMH